MSALYLDHFGLSKPPFKITPDLEFFFSGGRRGDILSALLHVASHEEGIITVVAEVGSGKTLLSRLMLSQLAPTISTVYLANPCFSRDEILSAIARDLGVTDLPISTEAKLSRLQQELLQRHAKGQRVLLVVDEAHAMPPESLEEVRLLSNLETASHKLVNIMLFGQPELDTLLADPRLRQVRDRVIHRFELLPLPPPEACSYVDHRLRAAGWSGAAMFSKAALALLTKSSGGRARRINLLADKALLGAYAEGARSVERRHVQSAIGELHSDVVHKPVLARRAHLPWLTSHLALACVIFALAVWWIEHDRHGALPKPVASANAFMSEANATELASATNPPVPAEPSDLHTALAQESAQATAQDAALAATLARNKAVLEPYLKRSVTLLSQPHRTGYTLQLASLSREESAEKYFNLLSSHVDMKEVFALLSSYSGRKFVSVYFGQYPTMELAKGDLAQLPEPIKTSKPIVRAWARIEQDQAP